MLITRAALLGGGGGGAPAHGLSQSLQSCSEKACRMPLGRMERGLHTLGSCGCSRRHRGVHGRRQDRKTRLDWHDWRQGLRGLGFAGPPASAWAEGDRGGEWCARRRACWGVEGRSLGFVLAAQRPASPLGCPPRRLSRHPYRRCPRCDNRANPPGNVQSALRQSKPGRARISQLTF